MFIELHLIQNFAPANLNRDDTGSPKDAIFGGHRRARISSQAFKAAIRREPIFAETTQVPIGQRTKRLVIEISGRLQKLGHDSEQATAVAIAFAEGYAGKVDTSKDDKKTSVLLYLSEEEFSWIASQLDQNWNTALEEVTNPKAKKELFPNLVKQLIKETDKRTSAPDIAMFGRMLADKPTTNIEAACQVAHAISTHRVSMEMDYYTALDHLKPNDTAGADMVGFTSFNSACYYRYLRLDWGQLVDNLKDKDLARRTVEAFLRAALVAIPTGKQNSFAAQNSTSFALAVARTDGQSWNLANAFEVPVKPTQDETGYIQPSIEALDAYWHDLASFYDNARINSAAVYVTQKHQDSLTHLAPYRQDKLSAWVNTIISALPQE